MIFFIDFFHLFFFQNFKGFPNDNQLVKSNSLDIKEYLDPEQSGGAKVKIWLSGFEQNIKLAIKELDKLSWNLSKENGIIFPLHWDIFPKESDYLTLFEQIEPLLYQELKQKIEKNLKNPIYKIERVQNRILYEKFYKEKENLSDKRKNDWGANPKHLFYGSSINPEEFFFNKNESFDPRLDNKGFLMFFTNAADAYKEAFTNSLGQKVIVYAEVLVGKSFEVKGWELEKKLPPKDGDDRYDSVSEKLGENGEIVRIFEMNKGYIEYLITFQKDNL